MPATLRYETFVAARGRLRVQDHGDRVHPAVAVSSPPRVRCRASASSSSLWSLDLGELQIEARRARRLRRRDDQASEPLVSAGTTNHGSGARRFVAGWCPRTPPCTHPVGALADVADRELPVLLGLVEAFQEPFLLFLPDTCRELPDHRAVRRGSARTRDVLEPLLPDVRVTTMGELLAARIS